MTGRVSRPVSRDRLDPTAHRQGLSPLPTLPHPPASWPSPDLIRGSVPAIHDLPASERRNDVDAQPRAGHDDGGWHGRSAHGHSSTLPSLASSCSRVQPGLVRSSTFQCGSVMARLVLAIHVLQAPPSGPGTLMIDVARRVRLGRHERGDGTKMPTLHAPASCPRSEPSPTGLVEAQVGKQKSNLRPRTKRVHIISLAR
jgi:hypothetical protein